MSDATNTQEKEWHDLHDLITEVLDRHGIKDPVGEGDYWLLDENWGWCAHQVEFQNLSLFQPEIVKQLQKLLMEYPDWEIRLRVTVPGMHDRWPAMGLVVTQDQIKDQLQRQYLPAEFRDFIY
jgi:hypothetical protein